MQIASTGSDTVWCHFLHKAILVQLGRLLKRAHRLPEYLDGKMDLYLSASLTMLEERPGKTLSTTHIAAYPNFLTPFAC